MIWPFMPRREFAEVGKVVAREEARDAGARKLVDCWGGVGECFAKSLEYDLGNNELISSCRFSQRRAFRLEGAPVPVLGHTRGHTPDPALSFLASPLNNFARANAFCHTIIILQCTKPIGDPFLILIPANLAGA